MSTVAVALCNYNHARYLRDCLQHIFDQTRVPDQVVIVDDGSTDDSWNIIDEFSRRYPQLQRIANGQNRGVMVSLDRAMKAITCDYVVSAAADDLLLPDFIARNMAALERHPTAGVAFSELVSLIGDTGEIDRFAVNPKVADVFNLDDVPEYLEGRQMRERMRRAYLPMPPNTAVIKRDYLAKFGGFSPALSWCTDTFTCTALAIRYGACFIPAPLALIRSSPNTESQKAMRDESYVRTLETVADSLAKPGMRDVRRFMRACPSNMTVYGNGFLRVLSRKVRDWDLMVTLAYWNYIVWPLIHYKKTRNVTGAEMARRAARRWLRLSGQFVQRMINGVAR